MKRIEGRAGAWALVTGAGSGIGRCYALRLAAQGFGVVLAGERRDRLEAVAREIEEARRGRAGRVTRTERKAGADSGSEAAQEAPSERGSRINRTAPSDRDSRITQTAQSDRDSRTAGKTATAIGAGVRIIPIDLARTEAARELWARLQAEGIAVDLLINNAGIFSFRDILSTPPERIERIILLHDVTATQLCRLAAADMIRRRVAGHILNMASFSLWMPFPGLALYSASKAYLKSFSVAFAREVRDEGIRVTAVCPAGVATDLYGLTPYWQRIGLRLGVLISADSCARRGLRALARGRRCIVPDWWNRLWIPLCKILPMCVLRPLRRYTMKFQK